MWAINPYVYHSEMEIEGVVLTGGASRRMGQDKSQLTIQGEVLSERIARTLSNRVGRVTILGRKPISGFEFVADAGEYAGPLMALSRFRPKCDAVLVASCDLPLFDARLIDIFLSHLLSHDAVLPEHDGKAQPLCALYKRSAWPLLEQTVAEGRKSVMAWIDRLSIRLVTQDEIRDAGVDPNSIRGVNTPEELQQLLTPRNQ